MLTKDTMPQTYKRKRSWSRAVFSNLQRKGLEKRFEIQKYVTKPDRKQLAAMLGLTDAQVSQLELQTTAPGTRGPGPSTRTNCPVLMETQGLEFQRLCGLRNLRQERGGDRGRQGPSLKMCVNKHGLFILANRQQNREKANRPRR